MTPTAQFWLLALPAMLVPLAPAAQAAELYRLDGSNTEVSFDVRLFSLPWVSAHFAELSGELVPDRRASASRLDVTVRTASLACESSHWNALLLSSEWFDAQRFPQISYHSERIQYDRDGGAIVDGQLSLHGLTRNVVLTVSRWICSSPSGSADSCTFDAHARIRRSDYGLPHGFWEGGDEVGIVIHGVARAL